MNLNFYLISGCQETSRRKLRRLAGRSRGRLLQSSSGGGIKSRILLTFLPDYQKLYLFVFIKLVFFVKILYSRNPGTSVLQVVFPGFFKKTVLILSLPYQRSLLDPPMKRGLCHSHPLLNHKIWWFTKSQKIIVLLSTPVPKPKGMDPLMKISNFTKLL